MALGVDPSSKKAMAKLMADLRKSAPEVGKETRRRFRAAARPVLDEARNRQHQRSGELRRKTRIRVTRGMVAIVASAKHARINEFGGRHPLWGDRGHWVAHKANPAIWSTVQERRKDFLKEADAAVYQAMKKAGFK